MAQKKAVLFLAFMLVAFALPTNLSSARSETTATITLPVERSSVSVLQSKPTPAALSNARQKPTQGIATNRKPVIVAEGDSISKYWGGNYTGIFKRSRPDIEFHGLAKGGSTIKSITARRDAVLALKPHVVSVFVGANDLGKYDDPSKFVDALFAYAEPLKAAGIKVVFATNLARSVPTSPVFNFKHNRNRKEVSRLLRRAVGTKIDAVVDFAADPTMGTDAATGNRTLFSDGLHPTDSTHGVGEGGQRKLARIYAPVMNAVIDNLP